MSGLTVRIEGDAELIRKLERMGADVDKVLGQALQDGAEVVQQAANPKAPGPNIAISDPKRRGSRREIKVGPDSEHWYYRFIETGAGAHQIGAERQVLKIYGEDYVTGTVQHQGFPARPFLRPAFDENKGRAQDAMGDVLKKAIEQGARS